MNKNKSLEAILFSVAGVVAMFFLAIAIYLIAGVVKARFDLTADQLFTLSSGTKRILAEIRSPVEIRFYASLHSKEMPLPLKTYAGRVEDLLGEYQKASNGKIIVKKLDPEPDSDAEESAALDGVEGQMLNLGGDKIYLGLAVSQLDSKEAIPALSPDRERYLEYDISERIARVIHPQKAVVGVMSGLMVFGMPMNPMMMQMGQQGQEPWVFISELKRYYAVKQVDMNGEPIPDDVKLLVVVYPKAITDLEQFQIDQFLLRGGKLIAFLDPLSIPDSHSAGMNPLQAAASGGASMDKLVKAWGYTFDINKVVADLHFVSQINQGRGGPPEAAPAVLSLTPEAINSSQMVTAQIDNLVLAFAGAFVGSPASGLKQTVLLHTSKESQLVERFMAEFSGQQILKDFTPSGVEYALALKLTGKFKTAFPEGKPKEAGAKEGADTNSVPALKESKSEGAVILVGDSDLLYDPVAVRVQNLFGQRIIMPIDANLEFFENMVDQFAGDENLIDLRSRASMTRPFTVVRDMQAQAQEKYQSKISALEKSLSDAETRLNELQRQKAGGQRFILSPEQQAEITKFQQTQAATKRELKQVRKDLRHGIDSLENRLEWINIAGMPVLVTIFGIVLALVKRKKTAAK